MFLGNLYVNEKMKSIYRCLAVSACVGLLSGACAPVAPPPPSLACKDLPVNVRGKNLAVQRALADLGYKVPVLDGQISGGTMIALRKFQQDMALPVDGQVNGQTLEALGFCLVNSNCLHAPSNRHGQLQAVQQMLSEQGYDPGLADGQMGPRTHDALRQFQADKGLRATGQADAATLETLGFCNNLESDR